MRGIRLVVVLLCAAAAALLLPSLGAAQVLVPIYDSTGTNFSDWQTNHPDKFYWDSAMGAYHYAITDGANDDAFVPVAYPGGSFRLEFDVFPQQTDWAGNFRLGLWDAEMRQETPSSFYAAYSVDDNGYHIYLDAVPESGGQGYVRPSGYTDGQWYHNVIEYSAESHQAMLTVSSGSGTFAATATGLGAFGPMDRIAMTSIGDNGYPPATGSGWVRNVKLWVPEDVHAVFDSPKAGGRYWLSRFTPLPIRFRLVDSEGAPVTTSEEVALEVTEATAPTVRTTYSFSEALGNLRFLPSLSLPAYEATFRRATYRLPGGGECTAVVKVGGVEAGRVEFNIGGTWWIPWWYQ